MRVGGGRPPLPAELTQLTAPRFRAPRLSHRIGGNLYIACSGHKNPNSVSSLWKGFVVNTEDSQGFRNLWLSSLTSF